MPAAILLVALMPLAACADGTGVDGTALHPPADGTATTTSAPSDTSAPPATETYGPITVSARKAFVGVNYEADPSVDENMDGPSRLGVGTVVAGPAGSEITITVYALDGYEYASRPVVGATGTVLRYVTVAWQLGELAPDDEDSAGSVTLVRDGAQLAEPGLLELAPQQQAGGSCRPACSATSSPSIPTPTPPRSNTRSAPPGKPAPDPSCCSTDLPDDGPAVRNQPVCGASGGSAGAPSRRIVITCFARAAAPMLLAVALAVSGCSSDETAEDSSADPTRSAQQTVTSPVASPLAAESEVRSPTAGQPATSDSATEIAPELTSTANTEMRVVDLDGSRYAVGRGISLAISPSWTDYEEEKLGTDGTSHEWAVGLPATTLPLPAGVQLSMGINGTGASFENLLSGTEQLVQISPGYMFLAKGETEIPGAVRAAFFRFNRNLDLGSGDIEVEQLQLILDMPAGEVSVLRFIGEAGKWEEQVGSAYDSLVVTEER